jgi:ribosomal protein S18 acetylase RimI-like enzyme
MQIRTAALDDLATLQALGRETYREHFASLWSAQGIEDFLDQDFSSEALAKTLDCPQRHQWLIAFDRNASPVGFSKVNWSQAEPTTGIVGAELQKIYVRASSVGAGFGQALLELTVQRAKEQGESCIWLDVLKSNLKARRFYERLGFRQVGDLSFSTDRREIGMAVMLRQLS